MSPHKKTTANKPLKCQLYKEDCFRDRDAFEAFLEYYKDAVIIVGRKVDLSLLRALSFLMCSETALGLLLSQA